MQQNVTLMLGALKIHELDVHTFMAILGSLSKFIGIAEEFGGTQAHTLRETFREHARVFFAQFHRKRMETLKESLEKETWVAATDVKKDFGIKYFKELFDVVMASMPQQRAYKRRKQTFFDGYSVQSNPFAADTDGVDIDELELRGKKMKAIARYKWEESANNPELLAEEVDELGTKPGNAKRPNSPLSPITSRANPRSAYTNARGSTSSSGGNSKAANPVVTGAPLIGEIAKTVTTYVGEYMHLMQLLPHMTNIVFDGLVQAIEYFIWSIHSFFAVSRPVMSNGDRNLEIVLRRIQSDLLLDPQTYEALQAAAVQQALLAAEGRSSLGSIGNATSSMISGIKDTFSFSGRDSSGSGSSATQSTTASGATASTTAAASLPQGTLTPGGVFYKAEANLTATQLRVARPKVPPSGAPLQQVIQQVSTAAGTLLFIRKILMELQPNFIELLGRERLAKVLSFAGTLAETTVPLRLAIFKYAPQAFISLDKQISSVGSGQWDSLDEDVRESSYVRPLVKDISSYIDKLKTMVKQSLLPAELLPEMVLQSLSFTMEICVEGYSKARRVTTEGHNIMLYDMQEIKSGLEKTAGIRNHDWSFLDEYVHAYHFPVDDLLSFFREHPWYTKSQLTGLVVSGPWNQKEKTRLLDALNYHGAFTASASNSRTSTSTSRSRSTSTSTSSTRR